MTLPGSYANGFAPRDGEPLYQELWRGCVGAWNPALGPTGLTLRDWSAYKNHGTLTNMDASGDWVPTGGRYALDFDATTQHVAFGDLYRLGLQSLTLSIWFRAFDTGNSIWLMNKSSARGATGRYAMNIYSGVIETFLDFLSGSTVVAVSTPSSPFLDGKWRHVAMTANRQGNLTLFVDGVVKGSSSIAAHAAVNMNVSDPFYIRAYANSTGTAPISAPYGSATLDDARVYFRAMSASEIRLLASRRGIAYDLAPRRRSRIFTGGFKAYWAARKAQIIGGGL
jgi:hypothetical protein